MQIKNKDVYMTPVVLVSALGLYSIPKIGAYLSTDPSNVEGRVLNIFNRFRSYFSKEVQGHIDFLGTKTWNVIVDIFFEENWITFLFYSIVLKTIIPIGTGIIGKIGISLVFLNINALISLSRWGIASCVNLLDRKIAKLICSRSFQVFLDHFPRNDNACSESEDEKEFYNCLASSIKRMKNLSTLRLSDINLLSLNHIPEILEIDPVFAENKCVISNRAIRDPVADPNEVTLYERSAISEWLNRGNSSSPVTRNFLIYSQLIERPALKKIIENRLKYHEQFLKSYIRRGLIS